VIRRTVQKHSASKMIATMPSSQKWLPVATTTTHVSTACATPSQRQRLVVERQTKNPTAADQAMCTDGIAEY
jgi:hypothetical protein